MKPFIGTVAGGLIVAWVVNTYLGGNAPVVYVTPLFLLWLLTAMRKGRQGEGRTLVFYSLAALVLLIGGVMFTLPIDAVKQPLLKWGVAVAASAVVWGVLWFGLFRRFAHPKSKKAAGQPSGDSHQPEQPVTGGQGETFKVNLKINGIFPAIF